MNLKADVGEKESHYRERESTFKERNERDSSVFFFFFVPFFSFQKRNDIMEKLRQPDL